MKKGSCHSRATMKCEAQVEIAAEEFIFKTLEIMQM